MSSVVSVNGKSELQRLTTSTLAPPSSSTSAVPPAYREPSSSSTTTRSPTGLDPSRTSQAVSTLS